MQGRMCTDLLWGHRLLGSLVQLFDRLLVKAQILLAADEDDGQALAEMQDLGDPLCRSQWPDHARTEHVIHTFS
jgi:hypothetical protein